MSNQTFVAKQTSPVVRAEGQSIPARSTRDGIPFVTTWIESLVLEGRVFNAAFAAMGATDIVELTAASDLDRPDFCVSVPNGTALIPLEINIAAKVAFDTDNDDGWFIVMGDPDAAVDIASSTVVTVAPDNNITSGGVSSVATVFENANTADIVDPTATKFLIAGVSQQHGLTTAAGTVSDLTIKWKCTTPIILKGPCAIYGWGGGNDVITWAGNITWAEVPEARYTV